MISFKDAKKGKFWCNVDDPFSRNHKFESWRLWRISSVVPYKAQNCIISWHIKLSRYLWEFNYIFQFLTFLNTHTYIHTQNCLHIYTYTDMVAQGHSSSLKGYTFQINVPLHKKYICLQNTCLHKSLSGYIEVLQWAHYQILCTCQTFTKMHTQKLQSRNNIFCLLSFYFLKDRFLLNILNSYLEHKVALVLSSKLSQDGHHIQLQQSSRLRFQYIRDTKTIIITWFCSL